jgi:UDP-2,3-diacylglucosamine pyrophosphatase LpxH
MKEYKSIFISDIHLFSKHCKTQFLKQFLKKYKSENLFLVGDIFDFLRLRKKVRFNKDHMDLIHLLLKKARHGTKIVFLIGNHDHDIKQFLDYDFKIENVTICNEYEYLTQNKRFIIFHGHGLDLPIIQYLYVLGDWGYNLLLDINHWFNIIRTMLNLPYWSLSQRIKHSVKNAVKYIEDYENNLINFCKNGHYDGLISGHIHKARLDIIDNKYIMNCGDWQESCTAIVEDYDGNFILLQYLEGEFKELKRIII